MNVHPPEHWYERLAGPYEAPRVPPVDFRDSQRIYDLLRAGRIYLSLSDAIALAIENNLDVQLERFGPPIADLDLLRAKGGGTLRGIGYTVTEIPPGIGGPATPLLNTARSWSARWARRCRITTFLSRKLFTGRSDAGRRRCLCRDFEGS